VAAVKAWIVEAVDAERVRQRVKWSGAHPWGSGDCSSPGVPMPVKALVLAEECGEVVKAVLDAAEWAAYDRAVRTELIQVAAVAVAILESMGAPDDHQ
jgi:hypothetical protein